MLKSLFCNHTYKAIKKKKSFYTSDYLTFDDLGCYDDILYECQKCGKRKVKTQMNKEHPLYEYGKWESI